MTYKNKSEINREVKDKDHPYTVLSNCLLVLNGYERAIMYELLSNSDGFIINKEVVMKRLQFPKQKFNDSWKSLEDKGHITYQRIFGGVKWIINESPKRTSNVLENSSTSTDSSTTDSNTTDSTTTYRQLINTKETSTKEINTNINNPLSYLDNTSSIG